MAIEVKLLEITKAQHSANYVLTMKRNGLYSISRNPPIMESDPVLGWWRKPSAGKIREGLMHARNEAMNTKYHMLAQERSSSRNFYISHQHLKERRKKTA